MATNIVFKLTADGSGAQQAFEKVGQAAKQYSATVSQAQKDAQKEIDKLTNKLEDLKERQAAVGVIGVSSNNKLAQSIAKVTEQLNQATIKADNLRKVNVGSINAQTGAINTLAIRIQRLTEARNQAFDTAKIERYNKVIADANNRLKSLSTTAKETAIATKEVAAQTTPLQGALNKIGGLVAGAFAVSQIISFGKEVLQVTGQLQSLQIRMEGIYENADLANKTLNQLRITAKNLGLDFNDLSQNFVQFVAAAKSTGMEVSKAEKIFNNMAIAIAGSGASSEQAQRAMTALTQMIGKGTIMSEELKGQLGEALPQAIGWMSKSLGISTKELMKMMEQGKLTSDALLKFSQVAANDVAPNVEKMSNSINGNINRLSNAWNAYMTSLGQRFYGSGGGAQVLADMLEYWTEINESEEQYVMRERARLMNDEKQIKQVDDEVKSLEKEKLTQEQIVKVLENRRDAQIDLARGYKEISGYRMESSTKLTPQEKIAVLNLINAYNEQIKAINEKTNASTGAIAQTEKEIAAYEKLQASLRSLQHEYNLAQIELSKNDDPTKKQLQIKENSEFAIQQERKKVDELIKAGGDKIKLEEQFNTISVSIRTKALNDIADVEAKKREDEKKAVDEMQEYFRKANEQGVKERMDAAEREAKAKKDLDEQIRNEQEIGAKNALERRQANINYGIQATAQAANDLTSLIGNGLNKQSQDLQKQKQRGLISEEEYNRKVIDLQRKKFNADKQAAMARIIINTAASIAASLGNPVQIAIAAGLGAVELGVAAAQRNPYFHGTKSVPGVDRSKDSVNAILAPGERVVPNYINGIPAYSGLMDLVQDRRISPAVAQNLTNIALHGIPTVTQVPEFDYEAMGKSIGKYVPSSSFSIDRDGVALISVRQANETRRLKSKI